MARNSSDGTTLVPEAPGGGDGYVRFVESGGAALKPAEKALYGVNRPSKDRFQQVEIEPTPCIATDLYSSWMFPPHKEIAVAESLNWIQHMSYGLATLGVSRYLA